MTSRLLDVGYSNELLIIAFGGVAKKFGGIQPFEFLNFLKKHYPNIDKHFYVDQYCACYNEGIKGITNNIEETLTYLRNQIKKYKKIVFVGVSGGGYAAILFGSLLNIDTAIAFIPTTILRKTHANGKYSNLRPFINQTTKYYLYGDVKYKDELDCHHINHCLNIAIYPNVFLTKLYDLDLKDMRDSGYLFEIFNKHITF
jgi:hypothetical protein